MTENQLLVKTTIHELPEEIRPRERLIAHGAQSLTSYELLAIILRTGNRNLNAIQLAMKILQQFGTQYDLRTASFHDLIQVAGVGPAKAVEIQAAIEFGRRLYQTNQEKQGVIMSTKDAGDYCIEKLKDLQQENVFAIYLNTKNQIIKEKIIFIGTLNSSVAHPREIFKEGVRCSAARIIVAHNHPSGNPSPSQADIEFTKRLAESGDLIGIEVLDHIIVGDDNFLSLQELGIF
ncbi:JAB domain-containing protein [Aerococcus agrisoli]|uniref:JAB domain-containing protein n=1 Tax=Aerococcus agrisoli TaxID=2487350 RepID=A0A3N4GYF3_9LACT|nr:DNA repair protein RadC [Aerococcus agrisoli]RPA63640.1 JAB domain-containing protein [Aerococcus agrisoli]